jgi:bidirectional [NiFe] hydrogenase diaphorase subunit
MDLAELQTIAGRTSDERKPCRVLCCTSSGCRAAHSLDVKKRLDETVATRGLSERINVVAVGCLGFCGQGPLVDVQPDNLKFERVTPEQAPAIIGQLAGESPGDVSRGDPNHPFYAGQLKIVRETSGRIEPERIEDYIAEGGYQSLFHAVTEMTPAEIVQEMTKSGLRGRGGAGYPTGLKWGTVAKMPSGTKYVICNGDEGDPGAFMDRSVMEDDPHRVLEGMAIAGYAVGATQGFIYVRAEYPLAVERLRKAIQQATRLGVLGPGLFGTNFDFKIDIRIGAGAFVCGEETALIASVEGRRGTPRPRPPYPAESGLWGQPTLINNVETYANVPAILRNGAAWFAAIGTERSKGTKVFSLTGKVRNSGLVEVPMGTTVRHIVEVMGGGVPNGRVKAVQTGGPSGGCIPAEKLDVPVDYESLTQLGSIMGSGGMIVMDQDTNMVEVARFFMDFCMDESCGKCIPCRAGTVQMYRLLSRLVEKQATQADLDRLVELCHMTRETSLCGLGQTAPNPVLSTLRYFRGEYDDLLQKTPPRTPRSLPVVHLG